MTNRRKRETLDRAMERALKRRLRQDQNLDVPQWKRGWYAVGRVINPSTGEPQCH